MPGLGKICICVLALLHLAWARCINKGNNVFIYDKSADSFLSRSLLYNSWDFELVTPGNIERECYEEQCTYEEAREVYEDDLKTQKFWAEYTNSHSPPKPIDLPGLLSGVVAAVTIAVIALVLGCYCYKNKARKSVPVQMAADARPAPELVPLAGITAPGLPSYREALDHSGQYDAPPPPYAGPFLSLSHTLTLSLPPPSCSHS
uniref:Proline rich Gla (G-carboxyglutamic acid) 2 n=1 Tax=Astyanax mexicanus TaxID=7994 RepID=W5KSM9_ASTMX